MLEMLGVVLKMTAIAGGVAAAAWSRRTDRKLLDDAGLSVERTGTFGSGLVARLPGHTRVTFQSGSASPAKSTRSGRPPAYVASGVAVGSRFVAQASAPLVGLDWRLRRMITLGDADFDAHVAFSAGDAVELREMFAKPETRAAFRQLLQRCTRIELKADGTLIVTPTDTGAWYQRGWSMRAFYREARTMIEAVDALANSLDDAPLALPSHADAPEVLQAASTSSGVPVPVPARLGERL